MSLKNGSTELSNTSCGYDAMSRLSSFPKGLGNTSI